jgi:hypothetical protein
MAQISHTRCAALNNPAFVAARLFCSELSCLWFRSDTSRHRADDAIRRAIHESLDVRRSEERVPRRDPTDSDIVASRVYKHAVLHRDRDEGIEGARASGNYRRSHHEHCEE